MSWRGGMLDFAPFTEHLAHDVDAPPARGRLAHAVWRTALLSAAPTPLHLADRGSLCVPRAIVSVYTANYRPAFMPRGH